MDAIATFETEHASRYLEMLCKHFARRLDVTFDGHTGQVELPFGQCCLSAEAQRLKLVATASNERDLDKVEEIISSHLERYAFRESPELVWKPNEPATRGGDAAAKGAF